MRPSIFFLFLALTFCAPVHAESKPLPPNLSFLSQDFESLQVSLDRMKLASLYQEGRYDEAFSVASTLLKSAHQLHDPLLKADTLEDIAKIFQLKGRYPEAEKMFKQVMAIRKDKAGEEDPSYATAVSNLGLLYENMGEYKKALRMTHKAWKIRLKVLGADHPETAISLNNLAGLYRIHGEEDKAEECYREALRIWTESGESQTLVAKVLNNLAIVYEEQNRIDESLKMFWEAYAIRREAYGENHPSLAVLLNNMGGLYKKQGQFEKAESLYKQAEEIWVRTLGADHPYVARVRNNRALLYQQQGRLQEAEKLFREALDVARKSMGEDHPFGGQIVSNLVSLYQDSGRLQDAEALKQKYLKPETAVPVVPAAKRNSITIGQTTT
ncbi:MAG TPA: tetratricopeptide repeat protein [Verrucomicrobiae bacterium]|nr:tetratricopeptide repeat protein [Verrucomicrobiae bacterium]